MGKGNRVGGRFCSRCDTSGNLECAIEGSVEGDFAKGEVSADSLPDYQVHTREGASGVEPGEKRYNRAAARRRRRGLCYRRGGVSRRGGASARFFRENRSSGATGRNIVKAVCP